MTPLVSIFLPTIRVHRLPLWYNNLLQSLAGIPFEVVCAGPFEPHQELLRIRNFKWINTHRNPTSSAQMAAIQCRGWYILHSVDDCLYLPKELAKIFRSDVEADIVGLPYTEGKNFSGNTLPTHYWLTGSSFPGWSRLNPQWGINCHFIIEREKFIDYGGFDCRLDYLVTATNDMLWRMQKNGLTFNSWNANVSIADWMEGETGDHMAIHRSAPNEFALLHKLWNENTERETIINLFNYLEQPEVWKLRFGEDKPTSYQELYPNL